MSLSARLPLIAAIVAFSWAALAVFYAYTELMILLVPAVVPLAAGIGILRRRAWAAYGFALYLAASTLLVPFLLVRSVDLSTITPEIAITIVSTAFSMLFQLALIVLFFLAGRSLAAAGAKQGWPVPWVAIATLATTPFLFVQAFVIPTGAMEDTLLIGDHILVRRFPTPTISHEDILVFRYPADPSQTFVKRVIGKPGDRIRISDKVVYRNGTALDEPYAVHKTAYIESYRDNFPSEPNMPIPEFGQEMLDRHVANGELLVPEESYFVLGDNRDLSLDSRYWGFVRFSDVIGEPLLIYHSEERPLGLDTDGEQPPPSRLRWNRFLKVP